ncbi:MAG: 5'/3'-nucleotidase SurE [Tissierellia bacterium]|nr:5'/3'-nucleotidase SurE [Tissierellia bacterium]
MRILLVNDDGIHAEGLYLLAKELEREHEIIIVAPAEQKSAQSQAITISNSLIVKEVKLDGIKSKAYSVSGTPADCVRVALDKLVDEKIDMVISGINQGLNVGMDVLYSGTVSAAIEANLYNIPAMALSAEWIDGKIDYDLAVKHGQEVLNRTRDDFIKNNIILSLNTPYLNGKEISGVKVCKIGNVIYDYYHMEDNEVNGEKVLKLHGRQDRESEEDTDRYYLSKGYVTITPLHYDLTNFKLLNMVESWF